MPTSSTSPNRHGASIKAPNVYDALRAKGMSKTVAAKISNAMVRSKYKVKVKNIRKRKR